MAFGLAWFFIQLLPISLIPRNDLLSERNLYLPSIGLLLAIVALGSYVIQRLMTIIPRPGLAPVRYGLRWHVVVVTLCFFTFSGTSSTTTDSALVRRRPQIPQ